MIEALHFLRPWWLVALIPAIALTLIWARHRVSGSHWEASIAPELLAVLLETNTGGRIRTLVWVVAFALCACAIGLAGPTWERLPQPVEQKNDALIIALDLSLSMFATDIAPSRLVRARQKVADVLRLRNEGLTALVAYAGDAHAVVPLTDDTHTIENLLAALSPEMMPVFGSKPSSALEVVHQLFENAHVNQGRILLVTDGVDRIDDITNYRDARFPVSILGLGTTRGANIPLDFANQPGRVLQSDQGDVIVVRLDEERLRDIARQFYGRYRTLTLNDSDIRHLLATPLPQDDETLEIDREFDTWADSGYWVCVILLPLLLLGFRRGVFAMLCISLLPPPVYADL
ncbi:MAG: VWA domain-containing protein, partial [Gammaproteobacteria bacterium]|nr:VWA domain-containing protein [Gammaproteobacteria bacterium]